GPRLHPQPGRHRRGGQRGVPRCLGDRSPARQARLHRGPDRLERHRGELRVVHVRLVVDDGARQLREGPRLVRQRVGVLQPPPRPGRAPRRQPVRLRTLDDLGDVAGKTVFLRADFNVPLEDGKVADDARIRATLPTITELLERNANLVIASHLGRPKGKVKEELRLGPVRSRLEELLDREVLAIPFPGEASAEKASTDLTELGENPDSRPVVAMLENLRFDAREEANDTSFAGELAGFADAYVDDAFGAAHRAPPSLAALPEP